MPPPLVSVLMTAYNREKYIAEAIESVLAQTFTDFELIIVDDCSTDRTVEIAKRYTHDPRVRLHVNPKNLGQFGNRNRAAELAQTRYLKYLDSDDVLYPYSLEAMLGIIRRFPEAGVSLGRPPLPDRPHPLRFSPAEAYREHFLGAGLLDSGPSGSIIRTSCFKAVGGFDPKAPPCGDVELWLRLSARFAVVTMPAGLVWWRRHQGQVYAEEQSSWDSINQHFFMNMAALRSPACPLTGAEASEAIRRVERPHARMIIRLFLAGHPSAACRLWQQSRRPAAQLVTAFSSPKRGIAEHAT